MAPEASFDTVPQLSGREQMMGIQRQFQTPQIAMALAQKFGLEMAIVDRPVEAGLTGDFYRAIHQDGRFAILFGDAISHGEEAAPTVNGIHQLLTPALEQVLLEESLKGDDVNIAQSILYLDEHLRRHREKIDLHFFGIPMMMVEIDKKNNLIHFANAGMVEGILLQNNHMAHLFSPGAQLGTMLDYKTVDSKPIDDQEKSVSFSNGDILVLMTDGVDADKRPNPDREEFDSRREHIEAFLQTPEATTLDAEQLASRIADFVKNGNDDITILVVRL